MSHIFSYEHFRENFDSLIIDEAGKLKWRHSKLKDKHEVRWGAWSFVQGLGIRYCPYCNAENIAVASLPMGEEKEPKLIAPALDHYFPKSKYPFLAISLYNLVPSCTRCNSVFKGAKTVDPQKELNPYRDDAAKRFYFETIITNCSAFSGASRVSEATVATKLRSESDAQTKNFLAKFRLADIYNWSYKQEILDRVIALVRYSDHYLEDMESFLPGCTAEERSRIIFACNLKEADINQDRFAKYTRDLASQFNIPVQ